MEDKEKNCYNRTIKIVQYILLSVGTCIWIYGWKYNKFNVIAVGMMCIFLQNIIFAARNIKERIVFLIFQGSLFTFLLSVPFIGVLTGEKWWNITSQAPQNIRFALLVITLSLVSIFAGALLCSRIKKEENTYEKNKSRNLKIKCLQSVSLLCFSVSTLFFFIQEAEKLMFIHGKTYLDYYSAFEPRLPGLIYLLASFMKYSLCIFLSTFPSKKKSFVVLTVFEISAIPSLIIGVRNPLILNSLFIFIYYFIRNNLNDEKGWIGKCEKGILIAGTPILIISMLLYSYIRSDQAVKISNPISMIVRFFEAMGMSFGIVAKGYGYRFNLPDHSGVNYTFGGIIDYIKYGRVGQILWRTEGLPPGNNFTVAHEGNNLSHHMSYAVLKDDYLKGRGLGSSYVLENYLDFGYKGVVLFSIVLGALLILFIRKFNKNVLLRTIILVSLTNIFFIPRAEATGWLTFIVTLQFWVCILGCYISAWFVEKSLLLQKMLRI